MQTELSVKQLYLMICRAEVAYEESKVASIARRTKIKSMKLFCQTVKAQSPNKNITLTLEDFLLLTQLPE